MKKYTNRILSVILPLMLVTIGTAAFAQTTTEMRYSDERAYYDILNSDDSYKEAGRVFWEKNSRLPLFVDYAQTDGSEGLVKYYNRSPAKFAKMLIEAYEEDVMAGHYDRISYFLHMNDIINKYKNPYDGSYDPIKLSKEIDNAASALRKTWEEVVDNSKYRNGPILDGGPAWREYHSTPEQVKKYESELTTAVEKYNNSLAKIEKKYPGAKISRVNLPSFHITEGEIVKFHSDMQIPNVKRWSGSDLREGEREWKDLLEAKKYLDEAVIKYNTRTKTAELIKSLEDPQQKTTLWQKVKKAYLDSQPMFWP